LVQNTITLLLMGVLLFSYGPWLPVLLLLGTIPAFYVVLRFDRSYHRWWQETTPERRRAQYYDTVLVHADSAAEVRLFDLSGFLRSSYQTLRRGLIKERLRQMRTLTLAKSAAALVALVIFGLCMAWMAWHALHGRGTLGDLALFYGAFSRGQSLMSSLLGSVGQIISNSLYLGNLFSYLDLKPSIEDPAHPLPTPISLERGIEIKDVNFAYPGSRQSALESFNLFIPAGKIVAVVGPNGAGKSTLVKLLCRFYEPDAGSIQLDGVDIRDIARRDLWQMVSVLFQFPVQYHLTARQNIAFGDLQTAAKSGEVEAAASCAGARELIEHLPLEYETILGKWFINGVELSGGEWQRIALARAYIRKSRIIILDEPTSFLDSWSETDWFERLRQLASGRTAIVITHRFTVAMRADIIHVMDQGKIIESGTHQQLVARGGTYAQSWLAQTQAASSRSEVFENGGSSLIDSQELQVVEA
jgi:ATP-binding cassette, subfamily B, bacterial